MSERSPRQLRLLLYTDATTRAGAEQSVGNLLAHLSARIEAFVLGVDQSVVEWLAAHRPGTETRTLPGVRNKFDLASILAHVRAVRDIRPDVFHANLPWTFSCQYGLLAALLTPGVRTVAVDQCPMPPTSRQQLVWKREISKRVQANVAVGVRSARMLEDFTGLARGTARAIYNGVPDRPIVATPRADSNAVVGSVGRLSPQKGFDVLVRAVAKLAGVRLVLVGDGPERGALEKLAVELGMADRLEITGWSDQPREYLPTFDVFALASNFEGFPLVIPEAMLAGVPVVAADVGSVAEAVVDEKTGFLVQPGNPDEMAKALMRVLEDPEASRRMGERGRLRAQELFTAPAMARAFESLYVELCRW